MKPVIDLAQLLGATPMHSVSTVHVTNDRVMRGVSLEDGSILDAARPIDVQRNASTGEVLLTLQVLCPNGLRFVGDDGYVVPVEVAFPEPRRIVVLK